MVGNFTKYLQASPIRKPGIVVVWGRFNPPTKGHETVFNEAAAVANHKGFDLRIYASRSQDPKSNPLPVSLKVEYLQEIFPRYAQSIMEPSPSCDTIVKIFKSCQEEYNNFILVVGQDRVDDFHALLTEKVESNYRSIEVWSAGDRDPEAKGVKGVSANKMREYALRGDYANFKAALPGSVDKKLAKALMEDIKFHMTAVPLRKAKPKVILEKPEGREEMYNGQVIVGSVVESPNGIGFVVSQGTNYYEVAFPDGSMSKFFPNQVTLKTL